MAMKNLETGNNPITPRINCGILTVCINNKYKIDDAVANKKDVILLSIDIVNKKSTLVTTFILTFIKSIRAEFISFKQALKAANDHHSTFQRVVKDAYIPHLFGMDKDNHEEEHS